MWVDSSPASRRRRWWVWRRLENIRRMRIICRWTWGINRRSRRGCGRPLITAGRRLRQALYNGGLLTQVGYFDGLQKAGKAIPFGHFILYREIDATAANGEATA